MNTTELQSVPYLTNEADIDRALAALTPQIGRLRIASFDLDGTLCGRDLQFPKLGLSLLKQQLVTAIASGAGPSSVGRKLSLATSESITTVGGYFNGPTIANEGAQIFRFETDLTNPQPEDLLVENPIEEDGLEAVSQLIKADNLEYTMVGFYPSVRKWLDERLHHPFQYIMHIPDGLSSKMAQDMATKYPTAWLLEDSNKFRDVLIRAGASKLVIKAKEVSDLPTLQSQYNSASVNSVINEGFLNIVSGKIDKFQALLQIANFDPRLKDLSVSETAHFGNDFNDLTALVNCQIGVIVDSDFQVTSALVKHLKRQKRTGSSLILSPTQVDTFLIQLAQAVGN